MSLPWVVRPKPAESVWSLPNSLARVLGIGDQHAVAIGAQAERNIGLAWLMTTGRAEATIASSVGALAAMRQVDHHADPVHLGDDLAAEAVTPEPSAS